MLVTKRTRRKHCTFVTKCVRFEKKFYWTKRCYCKNANSSLMDTVALATIRVTMERNGTIAKAADINSHLAKTRNSITSGTKTQLLVFIQKGRFHGLFVCLLKMTYICKLLHFTFTIFKFYYTETSTMHKWIIPHIFYFNTCKMSYK